MESSLCWNAVNKRAVPLEGRTTVSLKVSPGLTQRTNILTTNGVRACLCNDFVEDRGTCIADQSYLFVLSRCSSSKIWSHSPLLTLSLN